MAWLVFATIALFATAMVRCQDDTTTPEPELAGEMAGDMQNQQGYNNGCYNVRCANKFQCMMISADNSGWNQRPYCVRTQDMDCEDLTDSDDDGWPGKRQLNPGNGGGSYSSSCRTHTDCNRNSQNMWQRSSSCCRIQSFNSMYPEYRCVDHPKYPADQYQG